MFWEASTDEGLEDGNGQGATEALSLGEPSGVGLKEARSSGDEETWRRHGKKLRVAQNSIKKKKAVTIRTMARVECELTMWRAVRQTKLI